MSPRSKKHFSDDYKDDLEKREIEHGVYYFVGSSLHEFLLVNQKEIAFHTFGEKNCYFERYNSVPCGSNSSS